MTLDLSLADIPWAVKRLDAGQFFNTYQTQSGDWSVGIGPVTDFASIASALPWQVANLFVDALRLASGQPSVSEFSRAFDDDQED